MRQMTRANLEETYQYDSFGGLLERSDGQTAVRYKRDNEGRVLSETWSDLTTDEDVYWASFRYTPFGELLAATDSVNGDMAPAADLADPDAATADPAAAAPLSSYDFTYDSQRQLDRVWQTWGDSDERFELDYDINGLGDLTGLTLRHDRETLADNRYEYDGQGRLEQMTQAGDAVSPKRVEIEYRQSLGERLDHGEKWEFFSDSFQPDVQTEFGWRGGGQTTHVRHIDGQSQPISSLSLTYDDRGRLTTETRSTPDGVTDYEKSIQFDETGALARDTSEPDSPVVRDAFQRVVEDRQQALKFDHRGNVARQTRFIHVADSRPANQGDESVSFGTQTLLKGRYRVWGAAPEGVDDGYTVVLLDDSGIVKIGAYEAGKPIRLDFEVERNLDFEDLEVRITADNEEVAIPGGAKLWLQRARDFEFQYDAHDRLVGAVEHVEGGVAIRHGRQYDVLGNLMRQTRDDNGDGVMEMDRRHVSSTQGVLLEWSDGKPQRIRWLTPDGKRLVSVENTARTEDGWDPQGAVWVLPDHRQVVRDVVYQQQVTAFQYDALGRPKEHLDPVRSSNVSDAITARMGGFEYDGDLQVYLQDGRVFDPFGGAYLTDDRRPAADGYAFAGVRPTGSGWLSEGLGVVDQGWGEYFGAAGFNFVHYAHPNHNPPGPYSGVAAAAKWTGWAMYTVGSIGSGGLTTAALAQQTTYAAIRAAARSYLVQQAIFTAAEVGVEYAMCDGPRYPWVSRIGQAFALNTVTGVMGGSGSIANRIAGFMGRQTLELGVRVGYEVATGRDLVQSVAFNGAAAVGGEVGARGLLGIWRGLRSLPQVNTWMSRNRNYELIVSRVPGNIRHHHTAVRPGPLSDHTASTFSGGRYAEIQLSENMRLYRVWDPEEGVNPLGGYWSLDPNHGTTAQIDLALRPEWGNAASHLNIVEAPAGTVVYVGEVATQGAQFVGGGTQVLVEGGVHPEWVIDVALTRRDYSYRNLNSDF